VPSTSVDEAAETAFDAVETEDDLAEAEGLLLRPGFADLEAAVALVEAGLATRVVLAGFPSWPGLLYQARELAEWAGVQVLPTVVRPGGLVDIVILRDTSVDG
jgi:hypothetical protein